MKFEGLLHFNIRCTKNDLPKIEKFYGEVMGLKKGYRPNFNNEGLWLDAADEPILHVGARVQEGFLSDKHNASFDHMAFRMKGASEFRDHVRKLGVQFEEQNCTRGRLPDLHEGPGRHRSRIQFSERGSAHRHRTRHDGAAHQRAGCVRRG